MNNVTSENYVNEAMRTDCVYDDKMKERLVDCIELLHGAMGMVTEAGELIDMLKKHIFYGKNLDLVNAIEEVGDEFWYNAKVIDAITKLNNFTWTMNEVLTQNNKKLRLRYPNKFTEECAIERNVVAERELLEAESFVKKDVEKPWKDNCFLKGSGIISESQFAEIPSLRFDNLTSQRSNDWCLFQDKVLEHIENYTVKQYGDKGEDQITEWTVEECLKAVSKRIARYGRQSREGQQELDFLKMAHEIQIAATKYEESKQGEFK